MAIKKFYLFVILILLGFNLSAQDGPDCRPLVYPYENARIFTTEYIKSGTEDEVFIVGESYFFSVFAPRKLDEIKEISIIGGYDWYLDTKLIGSVDINKFILIIPAVSEGVHVLEVKPLNECGDPNVDAPRITRDIFIQSPCEEGASLTGGNNFCTNGGPYDFQMENVTDTYSWSVSNGGQLTSNGNVASINFPNSGQYEITATSNSSDDCKYYMTVNVKSAPEDITDIDGWFKTCEGNTEAYTIEGSESSTFFDWGTAPAGLSYDFLDAAHRSVEITYSSAGSYNLNITPQNSCGYGASFTKTFIGETNYDRVEKETYTHTQLSTLTTKTLSFNTCSERTSDCLSTLASVKLKVDFKIGQDYNFGSNEVAGQVEIQLTGLNSTGGSIFTNQQLLNVNFDKPEALYVYTPEINIQNLRQVQIDILSYSITGPIENDIQLDVEAEDEIQYSVKNVVLNSFQANATAANSWDVLFQWNSSCTQVENYQLRILKVFEGQSVPEYNDDWKNALVVETESSITELQLTLAEGSGNYVWQVRPIGNKEGGASNKDNYLSWPTTVQSFSYSQPDEDKNYIYSRTFTEGNKVSEQLTFASGLQKVQQQQTRLQSSGSVVATQTVQDFVGRDVIQSLPVPVKGKSTLGYEDVLMSNGSEKYEAKHFDDADNIESPEAAYLDKGTSDKGYYGNINNGINANVADAEGVPFTQTTYMADGSGRVKKQAGVGATHSIAGSRTIRYYYAGVAQDELNIMFGDEAPLAENTSKSITVDANNTTSINYLGKDGKTIATALAIGTGNDNLDGLPSREEGEEAIVERVNEKVPFGTNSSSSSKKLVFTLPASVKVDYSITPATISDICNQTCKTCDYVITFILHNLDDPDKTVALPEHTIMAGGVDCGSGEPDPISFDIQLDPGSYSIEKRVRTRNRATTGNLFIDDHLKAVEDNYKNELKAIFDPIDAFVREDVQLEAMYSYLDSEGYQVVEAANGDMNYEIPVGCEGEVFLLPYLVNDCDQVVDCSDRNNQDFIQYFADYWNLNYDRIDHPIDQPIKDIILYSDDVKENTFPWLKYKYGPTKAVFQYNVFDFNIMMKNLLNELDEEGEFLYDCQMVWQVWKQQVQNYEHLSNLEIDSGDEEFPEDYPITEYEYNFLANFFNVLNSKVKEARIEELKAAGTPDVDINPTEIVGLKKVGFFEGTPSRQDMLRAYELFHYIPSDEQMKNCMEGNIAYYNENNSNECSGVNYSTIADQFDCLSQISKQNIYECINYGSYDNENEPNIDDDVLRLTALCHKTCDDKRDAFRQSVINDIHKQGLYIEGDLRELEQDLVTGIWMTIGELRANPSEFDFEECQIDDMAEALVNNCKGYCQVDLVYKEIEGVNVIVGVGTEENFNNIRRVLTSTFEVNVSVSNTDNCEEGWDFLNYSSIPAVQEIQSFRTSGSNYQITSAKTTTSTVSVTNQLNNDLNEDFSSTPDSTYDDYLDSIIFSSGFILQNEIENKIISDQKKSKGQSNKGAKSKSINQKNDNSTSLLTAKSSLETFNMLGDPSTNNVPDDLEYIALRDLYLSMNGDSWVNKTNWNPNLDPSSVTFNDFSNWFGISLTSGGDIWKIQLQSNGLDGSVPAGIGNLLELKVLDLGYKPTSNIYWNKFLGSLPQELFSLNQLTILKIEGHPSENNLTGPFPVEIGNLTNLQILSFYRNKFDDGSSIPTAIGNLSSLTSLTLGFCNLSGEIPSGITTLPLINLVLIGDDYINGIPEEIGNLTSLEKLIISSAPNLGGTIPDGIYNLVNLTTLSLSYLGLDGEVKSGIGNLTNLLSLSLISNKLDVLSNEISLCTKLNQIFLSSNEFTGSLPEDIGNLTNLSTLKADNNKFTAIPESIGTCNKLGNLGLTNNNIFGPITENLKNCNSLYYLGLSNNPLNMEFPTFIQYLTNLREIYFSSCQLYGTIPDVFGDLESIQRLYLYNNNLEGQVPESIKVSYILNLSDNNFSGELPLTFNSFVPTYVYMYNNELSGYLPPAWKNRLMGFWGNNYTHGDIESLIDNGNIYYQITYDPQNTIYGEVTSRNFIIGQTAIIPFAAPGQYNTYFWQKFNEGSGNWEAYSSTVSSIGDLIIDGATIEDAGKYRCLVRNTILSKLSIYSHEQTLVPDVNTTCFTGSVCFRFDEPIDNIDVPTGLEDYVYNGLPYTCEELNANGVISKLDFQQYQYVQRHVKAFKDSYDAKCSDATKVNDQFKLSYALGYHHYTLYYYDRAGNLMRTVPPAGFNYSDGNNHSMETKYHYNSLGQLMKQNSPDGGTTKFYYNDIGQLRYSQNAQQKIDGTYSYTKYDRLGRIIEVGQSSENPTAIRVRKVINDPDLPSVGEEITKTVYTSSFDGTLDNDREQGDYLRNRVSYSYFDFDGNEATLEDRTYTVYNYDPHGNVNWLVQVIPGLGQKVIEYTYDLLSGNVLQVAYNPGQEDQFYHKYAYDEDNRIKEVRTSKDGNLWDKDASYEYYEHGPLKSAIIGEDNVQKLDYVYTIHGWLKAINNTEDGENQGTIGGDAFSMVLNYYSGDYSSAGASAGLLTSTPTRDLYNGNISAWEMATRASDDSWMRTGFQYTYDELNRIKDSRFNVYQTDHNDNGAFYDRAGFGANFALDANGNLTNLSRNDIDAVNFDALSYHLQSGKNRLSYVDDVIIDQELHTSDIEDQNANNYTYDAIGNLKRDNQEEMTINWSVYGKVTSIEKDNGSGTLFTYDAAGNRVAKVTTDDFGNTYSTYYVRDASGNIMATYKGSQVEGIDESNKLIEMPIYGSERIGIYTPEGAFENNQEGASTVSDNLVVTEYQGVNYELVQGVTLTLKPGFTFEQGVDNDVFEISDAGIPEGGSVANVYERTLDYKQYELKDHLGNVRAVVTDRKLSTLDGNTPTDFKPSIASASAYYPYGMDLPTVRWGYDSAVATMEASAILNEINEFDNYEDVTRDNDILNDHTHLEEGVDGTTSFTTNGVEQGANSGGIDGKGIIGLAKSFKVQAGDKIGGDVFAKISTPTTENTNVPAALINSILNAFTGSALGEGANLTTALNSDLFANEAIIGSGVDNNNPQVIAGISFIWFNEDFSDMDMGFANIDGAQENVWQQAILTEYVVPEDGYVFVYASNESEVVTDINFDDMTVWHQKLVEDEPHNPSLVAYRYGFNGKEKDQGGEWGLNHYDYGFRIYNPALGRFLSVDPLSKKYAALSPYQFAGNTPIQAIDLDGLEAYFVHGTASGTERWMGSDGKAVEGTRQLFRITNNKTGNASFSWAGKGNGLTNTKSDRKKAARKLARHVVNTMNGNEDITLIGHSHGGNVAIQASSMLRKYFDSNGYKDIKINLITVSTPVDNKDGSVENPATHGSAINQHTHLYNDSDPIQTEGANLFAGVDGTSFEREYDNKKTINVKIDVSDEFTEIKVNHRHGTTYEQVDGLGAHSFDTEAPNTIKKAIDNGTIKKQK